jgi:serine/threonine protein kinase
MKRPGDDRAAREAILGPAAAGVISLDHEAQEFGRYEVVASIGRGGMGEIYLARRQDKRSAGLLALKVLVAEGENDDDLVAMFMDEAKIMAQIHHPNVLEVLDFGREHNRYYLAMEYLAGRPLVRVMIDAYAREQGVELPVIAWIGAGAARGLDAAHSAVGANGQALQVVHRDVSPQNVFVTYAGSAKVIDFGVARAAERLAQTTAGQLKGKAAYMSPEQVQGMMVDRRSDVFSLGTCLWEVSAGRRLFKRENEWDTMSAVVSGPIVPPSKVRGQGDAELDQIILRALERSPDKRFQTAGELAARLEAFAQKRARDPAKPVQALLERLYGREAEQERALIAELERRSAKADEIDTLRQLSGISLSPSGIREMTLVGSPEALRDLDRFGVDATDPGLGGVNSTGPQAVQRAVQRLVEQRAPAKRASRWGVLAQVQPRAWLAAVALVVVSTVATVVVVSALRPQVPTELPIAPVDAPVDAPAAQGAPSESAAPEPRRLEPIAVAIAPDEGSPMRDDVAIARLAPELAQHQVTLSQDGDAVTVRGPSGQVEVGVDARTEPVNTGDVRGYLLTTRYPGATAATWVGGSATGPWRVVPLSVNDCPAEARSQAFGIELQYEKSYRFLVPYGGADFVDVEVPRPDFAERAELMPYGVAFGRSRPDRVALPCTVGWSAQGLRLERLPPGDYQVVWMGGARTEAQDVVVQRAGAPKIGPLVPR